MVVKRRVNFIILTAVIAFGALYFLVQLVSSSQAATPTQEVGDVVVYFPLVFSSASPQGSYNCLEYEFGLIWTSEVITLYEDGSSVYDYAPPYVSTVTGTWQFSPANQVVSFTNFTWPTATFMAPDRLWASRLVSDFEVALSCQRIE